MALTITPEDLRALYNDLTSQGYSHETLVNAAMQNYGIDLDTALASQGPISYTDNINSGPLETAPQPSYADYQASQPTYNEPIETEAVTGVRPGALASVTPQPVYTEPVYTPEPVYTEPVYTEPVYDPGPVFTPTADVSLTPSGGGALASVAALEPVVEVPAAISDQAIVDWFGNNPSEFDTVAAMVRHGVTEADIQRATGKTLQELYPSVSDQSGGASSTAVSNTSGALPVSTDTIAAVSDTGGALPVSTDTTGTSATGALSTVGSADAYRYTADPNAGQYVFDPVTGKHKLLSADQVYNNVEIPTFTDQYGFQEDSGTVVKTAAQQLTDWQAEQDRRAALTPVQRAIEDARYTVGTEGGVDTGYNAVNIGGNEWTVTPGGDSLIKMSQDQSGLGAKQYRYDLLDPVTGQVTQQIGVEGPGLWKSFLTNPVTGLILGLALPGVGSAIGSALGATTAAGAAALGSGVLNFGLQVAAGADPIDALKGAVLSAGAGFAGAQVSSMLPAELASAGKSAVTQLITTGKLDPAALATSVGTSFATDALAAETGLDKASAAKLVTAGLQAIQGNELAALTSLAQVGLQSGLSGTGVTAQSPQDRAAFLEANAAPLGLAHLSPNPTEDQLIDFESRTNAANQLLTDYTASGSDISRDNAIARLTSLGVPATKAQELITNADSQVEQRRVASDVMNRYSKIDPEFGTPQLDRQTAIGEMVAAGMSSERANELLNGVDAQNAIKFENRLSVQSAYQNFAQGKGTEEQLRSALTSAGYNDTQINDLVTRGRAILAGSQLTGGEQAQERASQLPDIRGQIATQSTFNDAFAIAREKLGTGATFNWQGKLYSTATADETKPLITTKAFDNSIQDQDIAARLNMGLDANGVRSLINEWNTADPAKRIELLKTPAFAGIKAIYDEKSVTRQLSPSEIASTIRTGASGSVTPYESNWVLAGRDLAQAIQDTVALVTGDPGNTAAILNRAGGQLLQGVGGATSTLGANILGGELTRAGQAIEDIGTSTSTYAQTQQNIVKAINDEPNWWNKAIIAGRSALNNPGAIADWTAIEGLQEGPALLAFGAAKVGKVAAGLVADGLESMGFAHNDARDAALAAGKSITEANKIGDQAGWLSMANTMATAGVLDARSVKALQDLRAGRITQEAAKEVVGGAFDEGATTAIVQAVSTGKFDPNAIGTTAILGGMIEGTTSGSLSTVGEGAHDKVVINNQLSTELAAGVDPATAISSAVNTGITTAGANSTTVLNGVVSSGLSNGVDPATVVSSTLTGALNNNVSLDTALSTVVGSAISNNVNPSTVVTSAIDSTLNNSNVNSLAAATMASNAAISSSLGVTGSATTAVTNVVAGTLNSNLATAVGANGATTLAVNAGISTAISNSVNPSTAISGAVTSAVNNGSNASTAVATAVATALASGVDTTTAVNSALSAATGTNLTTGTGTNLTTGTGTNLTVDTSSTTNLSTAVVTDTNNNTVTQVTNNSDSGITTLVVTNNNTGSTVTTSINNNSGIVTTTTVDGNIKTDVVVDATTNTTTTVATDVKTGQIINIDTVVGGQGNDVITEPPPVITEPPPVVTEPPPVVTEPPPVVTEPPPVTVTPQTRIVTPQPTTSGALPSALISSGGGGGALPGNLSPSMLEGAPIEALMNLPQLVQLYPQLANVDPRLLQMLSGRAGAQASSGMGDAGNLPTALSMTQAGAEPSPGMPVKAAKAATTNQDTKLLGGAGPLSGKLDALSAAGLTALNTGLGYAKGGLSHASGHNPEFITGATGYYVKGRGDGQSDDIPAMLADGEYVFDADTVAALGNGSSDAGAKILDKMRENIRKHKRSAHHSKIPPKAKSPLEYLKG